MTVVVVVSWEPGVLQTEIFSQMKRDNGACRFYVEIHSQQAKWWPGTSLTCGEACTEKVCKWRRGESNPRRPFVSNVLSTSYAHFKRGTKLMQNTEQRIVDAAVELRVLIVERKCIQAAVMIMDGVARMSHRDL